MSRPGTSHVLTASILIVVWACGGSTSRAAPAAVVTTVPTASAAAPIDHHAHIRGEAGTGALLRVQEALGQRIVGDDATPVSGADLVAVMDEAGVTRAAVLSIAYLFGIPEVEFPDEEALVRVENDFVAAEAARHPDRLVGFCGMNPLAEYALEEATRCAGLDGVVGIKLHLANSDVDLRDADHRRQLGDLFTRADQLGLAVVIHLRTRNPEYGREDVELFINDVLSRAPRSTIQIAHMAGWGGYDPATAAAVDAFVDLLDTRGDEFHDRLLFDIAATPIPPARVGDDAALLRQVEALNQAVADAVRRIGVHRVVFGTDWEAMTYAEQLETVGNALGLDNDELGILFGNVAPYFRTPRPR